MTTGFEDNFFTGVEDNPFEDPSIAQVTSNAARGLEDYNPFGENAAVTAPAVLVPSQEPPVNNKSNTPAVLKPSQEPPAYNRTGQQTNVKIDEFQRRQEELDRKAEELRRREEQLMNAQQFNVRRNNWPPLPDGFCLTPCFYLDIEVEIKLEFQRIVRYLYYLWISHGCMLILNVFGAFTLLIQFGEIESFGVSILYLVLFTPLSFLCWYRPVYKAFRNDSSFQFMVFFFVFFFQFLTTTFMAVGILGSGTCGILKAISCLRGSSVGDVVVGVIVLIISLGFSATAAAELLLLAKMLNIYRGTNASMDKARSEFTSEILGNQIVRDAARDTAAATIRSQFNQQPNRY